MGVAGQEIGNIVGSLLQSRGIRFAPEHQTDRIDPTKKEIHFQDDEMFSYDFLIGIFPVKMKRPSRFRHWVKVRFEKWWLRKWF